VEKEKKAERIKSKIFFVMNVKAHRPCRPVGFFIKGIKECY